MRALRWPAGWPRTQAWERGGTRYRVSLVQATDELHLSLGELGALSGSILLTCDSSQWSSDPGAAVYWRTQNREERVIACDRWDTTRCNIRAIGLAVNDCWR